MPLQEKELSGLPSFELSKNCPVDSLDNDNLAYNPNSSNLTTNELSSCDRIEIDLKRVNSPCLRKTRTLPFELLEALKERSETFRLERELAPVLGPSNTDPKTAEISKNLSYKSLKEQALQNKKEKTKKIKKLNDLVVSKSLNISIDFLRFSGSDNTFNEVLDLLSYYGLYPVKQKACNEKNYSFDYLFNEKGFLLRKGVEKKLRSGWESSSTPEVSNYQLAISGRGCKRLGADIYDFIFDVLGLLGVCPTRIDYAIDFFGDYSDFISNALKACEKGYFKGVRIYNPFIPRSRSQKVQGETLYLGSRGGEGHYVRIYDKGLESGLLDRGKWIRWETEFTGRNTCLPLVRELLEVANRNEPLPVIVAERAVNAVQFGKYSGNGKTKIASRFKLLKWYSELRDYLALKGLGKLERIPEKSALGTLNRWASSALSSYKAMADQTGLGFYDVLEIMLGDSVKSGGNEEVVSEGVSFLKEILKNAKRTKSTT